MVFGFSICFLCKEFSQKFPIFALANILFFYRKDCGFCFYVVFLRKICMTKEIYCVCRACGKTHPVEIHDSVNVSETPDLKSKVKDGSLFIWECPYCGAHNLINAPMLYHDPTERLMIWLRGPEAQGGDSQRTLAALEGMFRTDDTLKDYTARLVDSSGDLIEKVGIFDAGLDDVVMEMCKYVTRMESGKPLAGLRFVSLSGADNEITLTYPDNGQMEMLAIGFNVYEDCAGIVRRNPVMKERAQGLVKVDGAWISAFFG